MGAKQARPGRTAELPRAQGSDPECLWLQGLEGNCRDLRGKEGWRESEKRVQTWEGPSAEGWGVQEGLGAGASHESPRVQSSRNRPC